MEPLSCLGDLHVKERFVYIKTLDVINSFGMPYD